MTDKHPLSTQGWTAHDLHQALEAFRRADIRNAPTSTSGAEVDVTDTNNRLRDIAEYVRTVAATAANDQPNDRMVCWTTERIGGQDRVIQFRKYLEGDDHEIVALPAESGVAEHVATWDPRVGEAVATLLDVIADPAVGVPSAVHQYALRLAELLDEGR